MDKGFNLQLSNSPNSKPKRMPAQMGLWDILWMEALYKRKLKNKNTTAGLGI